MTSLPADATSRARPEPAPAHAAAVPASLLRHRSFVLFWCARTSTNGAYQMLAVAVGWQLYELTNNAFDLGILGLIQFIPLVTLAVFVGQIADRCDRRAMIRATQVVKALGALLLALGTTAGWLSREMMFTILFGIGIARAFEMPTLHAIIPDIVPQSILPRAIAAGATAQQTAIICGPAIGGFLYFFGPNVVYVTCAVIFVTAAMLVSFVETVFAKRDKTPISLKTLFAGFSYIRNRQILFGVISLDLFAVLLGGVTALLPIFARDILETGPWGLGLLRSAPAVGALTVSIILARFMITHHAGRWLFASVAAYGLAITLFGLSNSLVLSLIALAAYGAADAVSVVIRHSLVLSRTPNEMLGRVVSVNTMFAGSSGTLGEFRAGVMAASLGPVPAVVIGGLAAIGVTLLWMRLFPELPRIDKLTHDA
jgi:MFS family permease